MRVLDTLMTRRSLFKAAGVAGATAVTAGNMTACGKKKEPTKLAIVYTNDSHGHDVLDSESLGMAAAAQLRHDYVCAGGDTYYVFSEAAGKTMKTINYLYSDCVKYYLQEACGGTVPEHYADAAGQGRIEVIS